MIILDLLTAKSDNFFSFFPFHVHFISFLVYIVPLRIRAQEHARLDAEQKRERLLKIYFDS